MKKKQVRVAFVFKQTSLYMPLGITYLSAVLKKEKFETEYFFPKNVNDKVFFHNILDYSPELICYSVISGNEPFYLELNRAIKEKLKNAISVFGGPHVTFFPEIINEEGVDAVCIGEGDKAFHNFVNEFDRERNIPQNLANFWIKNNGTISKSSSMLPLITDLDSLPYPDREGFFRVNSFAKNYSIKNFSARRGCPYKCTYCFNSSYNNLYSNKNILRARSPESICDEVLSVRKLYPMKWVRFVDDVFTINKSWVLSFCEEYAQKIKMPFHCNIRLNNIDEDIVKALKDAGCSLVHVGAESGNEHIRNNIMKRRMNIDLIMDKVNLFHKYSIKIVTENIIGNPEETYEMALETLRLNQAIRPLLANCSLFTPYPKLPMTEYAIAHGYFDGNFMKINDNYYHETLINYKDEKEKNRILNLRSFFSLLSRFPSLESIFLKKLINLKYNKLIRMLGDFIDGYYLFKCFPYSMSPSDFIRTLVYYFSLPR